MRPARHHFMSRLLWGAREPREETVAEQKARTRALAQERLARHDTRPFVDIDVLPADRTEGDK